MSIDDVKWLNLSTLVTIYINEQPNTSTNKKKWKLL